MKLRMGRGVGGGGGAVQNGLNWLNILESGIVDCSSIVNIDVVSPKDHSHSH